MFDGSGAMLDYLKYALKTALSRVTRIRYFYPQSGLKMDMVTVYNLELLRSQHSGETKGSLFAAINRTVRNGRAVVKALLQRPLRDAERIAENGTLGHLSDILSRRIARVSQGSI